MGLRTIVLFWITAIWFLLALLLWGILHKRLSGKEKKYWLVCVAVLAVLYLAAIPLTQVPRYLGPDTEGVSFSDPAEAKRAQGWLPILDVPESDIERFSAKITYRDKIYRGKAGYEYKLEIVYDMRDGSNWTVRGFSDGKEADYSLITIDDETVAYYFSSKPQWTMCLLYRTYQGKGYIVERIIPRQVSEEEAVREILEAFP